MFDTPLSDRVSRMQEAALAAREDFEGLPTGHPLVASVKMNLDGLDYALAEVERHVTEQGF
jgi:hypothetical protein